MFEVVIERVSNDGLGYLYWLAGGGGDVTTLGHEQTFLSLCFRFKDVSLLRTAIGALIFVPPNTLGIPYEPDSEINTNNAGRTLKKIRCFLESMTVRYVEISSINLRR